MATAFLSVLLFIQTTGPGFKKEQLLYERVRNAYANKGETVTSNLTEHNLKAESLFIYIRAFKQEEELEVWGRNKSDTVYKLLKTFDFCNSSGGLGPKRQQGDYQIPEGFYHIDRFNPWSNFYLSLGINYPNRSDQILGVKDGLGGDIFIHGSCVTIGCIPLTDPMIKELYIYCVESKNNGLNKIPVTLFPARLTNSKNAQLRAQYTGDSSTIDLWNDLQKMYAFFEKNRQLPKITFLANGRHKVE